VQSLGYGEEEARRIWEQGEDLALDYQGKKYYVGAGHFQFLAPRHALQEVLPLPSRRPMGEVRLLDIAVNERGYLRLALPEFWVHHLGNTLARDHTGEAPAAQRAVAASGRRDRRLAPLRRLLFWVHQRTFDLLYRDS
jgi:hypothetical protein